VSRERTLGDLVRGLLERAFAGSAEDLMLALVDARGLTEEETRRIREIIRDAEKAEP
jgi:predicted transcriptional regulator